MSSYEPESGYANTRPTILDDCSVKVQALPMHKSSMLFAKIAAKRDHTSPAAEGRYHKSWPAFKTCPFTLLILCATLKTLKKILKKFTQYIWPLTKAQA